MGKNKALILSKTARKLQVVGNQIKYARLRRGWTAQEIAEKFAHDRAKKCGIPVPESKLCRYSDLGSTFLVKSFDMACDATGTEQRINFAFAMTMRFVQRCTKFMLTVGESHRLTIKHRIFYSPV